MKVLCFYGGIGSMAYAAKNLYCEVLGNIEPRSFEDGSTYLYNFPGTFFSKDVNDIIKFKDNVDILLGHPSCGAFSGINWRQSQKTSNEIESFFMGILKIKPRFFIMDNLEKSVDKIKENFHLLKDYNVYPQFITNRNYGNSQIRKRLYLIGALKELDFFPCPDERSFNYSIKDKIEDLYGIEGQISNHYDCILDENFTLMKSVLAYDKPSTYGECIEYFKTYPRNKCIKYIKKNKTIGTRIGFTIPDWESKSAVILGKPIIIHSQRNTPYTIRESLRLMGIGDDFKIIGQKPNDKLRVKPNDKFYKKVSKGVCIESITHFIDNIIKFDGIKGWRYTLKEYANSEKINSLKLFICSKQNTNGSYCMYVCKLKNICKRGLNQ